LRLFSNRHDPGRRGTGCTVGLLPAEVRG